VFRAYLIVDLSFEISGTCPNRVSNGAEEVVQALGSVLRTPNRHSCPNASAIFYRQMAPKNLDKRQQKERAVLVKRIKLSRPRSGGRD
jgi:hypothetical protein